MINAFAAESTEDTVLRALRDLGGPVTATAVAVTLRQSSGVAVDRGTVNGALRRLLGRGLAVYEVRCDGRTRYWSPTRRRR